MSRRPTARFAPVALSICLIVEQSPGIHFRGLGRAANLSSTGQLRHHVDRLRRNGALIEVADGRFRRYFVPGHDKRTRDALARFSRPVTYWIARTLLEGPMRRTRLRQVLRCADSTLGYHLNRMVEVGDIVRTRGRALALYSLVDREFVQGILDRLDGRDAASKVENGRSGGLRDANGPTDPVVPSPSVSAAALDVGTGPAVDQGVAFEA